MDHYNDDDYPAVPGIEELLTSEEQEEQELAEDLLVAMLMDIPTITPKPWAGQVLAVRGNVIYTV